MAIIMYEGNKNKGLEGKIDTMNQNLQKEKEEVFEFKPNFWGIGINIKNLFNWLRNFYGRKNKK